MTKLVGKKDVDFVSKDGTNINGVTLYITYSDPKVEGVVAEKIFVSSTKCNVSTIPVGAEIRVLYNRFGKVENVENVEDINL